MFLEKVVVPFLEANELKFVRGDGEVIVPVNDKDHVLIFVNERVGEVQSLHIVVSDIVSFPKNDGYLPTLLDELNAMTLVGKWVHTPGNDVLYRIDLLTGDDFGQPAFKRNFDCALAVSLGMKPKLLKVRWGEITLRRALSDRPRPEKEKSKRQAERLIKQALGGE